MSVQPSKIKLTSTEDGIHLDGSILWLDSQYSGDLSFLSNAYANQGRFHSRVIATEETIKILEVYRKRPHSLICQYNHPFAIGPLNMELLPSGVGLGGASLWVETKNKQIIYAPSLQMQKTDISHQMQIRPAEVLVIGAKKPFNTKAPVNRRKVKDSIVQKVQELLKEGQKPVILCEAFPTAQELTKALSENNVPIAAAPTISRINRIYETYGLPLGEFKAFHNDQDREGVLLLPMDQYRWNGKKPLPLGPLINVFDTQSAPEVAGVFRKSHANFYLPSSCEGSEYKDIASQVKPQILYIFGPYAKDYAIHLKNAAPFVKPLFPRHLPSLF